VKSRIGRNDPCPCGSGRKFKLCCALAPRAQPVGDSEMFGPHSDPSTVLTGGRFRFEAGSYGGPGGYLPSIACLKRDQQGGWVYHFVLVIPNEPRDDEQTALFESEGHLSKAFQGEPFPEAVAQRLKKIGYVNVSDFHVVPAGLTGDQGFAPGLDEYERSRFAV